MTWTQTTLTLKDAAGNNQPIVAFTDGTNYSLAHPILDNTGAIIAPATQGTLASVLSTLQASLALPTGASTAANQATGNTALATIATAVQAATPAGTNSLGTVGLNTGGNAIGSITNTAFGITGALPAGANAIGQVTANAGTNLNTSALALDTSVNGIIVAQGTTTSGQKGALVQAAVSTSAPVLTTGQTSPLSLDLAGNLRVNVVTGGSAGGGTSSSFAAAFPATGTAMGAKNGANMVNLTADASSNLNVNVAAALPAGTNVVGKFTTDQTTHGTTDLVAADITKVGGTALALGQAVSASSIPVVLPAAQITALTPPTTITANAGTGTMAVSAASLPLPAGAATATNQTSVIGSVGAGTAAINSELVGGVYNTSAPTLTTGQQAALQTDSSANLKVNVATALPTGTNSIGNIATVAAVTAITNALPAGANTVGNVGLVAGSAKVGIVTTDQTTHGTTDLVAADITKVGGAAFALGQQLAASALPVVLTATQLTALTPLTTIAVTQATGTNLHTVIDSGTITTVAAVTAITNALPAGTNLIGKMTPNDGTSSITIKAASTAAVATDTAQVSALSPNTPLPAGSNVLGGVTVADGSDVTVGAKADTSATTDTGTFSLIALFKRLLSSTTTLIAACQAATPAGTNLIGSINTSANTSGGTSTYAAVGGTGNALLTNSPVAVKASAGNLYGVSFVNTGNVTAFVQMFDLATVSVTLGTTPPKLAFWIPPGGSWEEKFPDEAKVSFATAITVAATTTATGGTAPATGVLANIIYK